MVLRQLRYFISVAENLNFTEAAKQLYVTQPTVSQQIIELENYLGVKLFVRDKRSVHLTPAGKLFLIEANTLINNVKEIVEKTRRASNGSIGTLKIGFLSYTIKNYLPTFIPKFRKKYPDIELQLKQFSAVTLREALLRGDIDIGFTFSFDFQQTSSVIWKVLFTDVISLALRNDHPLLKDSSLHLPDLTNEPFVTLSQEVSPYWFDLVMRVCVARGIIPKVVNQTSLPETPFLLAESGLGIAISSHYANLAHPIAKLHYFDIEGDDTRFDAVVVWKKEASNPSIPMFLDELEIALTSDISLIT